MLPSISLVVPAKNEEKVIGECLESLLNLDYPRDKLEIAVVIDDSHDKTLEIARKYEKSIKVFEVEKKNCKAEAINAVLDRLNGKIVGIFDADSVVDRDCIQHVVRKFEDKRVMGVAGSVKSRNRRENLLTRILSIETTFSSFTEYFLSRLGANAYFSGKNMFVRKDVLIKLGGFEEKSFLEDIELSIRMRRNKMKVVFEPRALAYQQEPASLQAYLNQRMRWARGSIRIGKMNRKVPKREWAKDLIHGLAYYLSPFSIIVATGLLFSHLFGLYYIGIGYGLLGLFLFSLLLLVYSRIYYKEPLRYLLLTPLWFFLSNFYALILLPKAYIDEKKNKPFVWYKTPRW